MLIAIAGTVLLWAGETSVSRECWVGGGVGWSSLSQAGGSIGYNSSDHIKCVRGEINCLSVESEQ